MTDIEKNELFESVYNQYYSSVFRFISAKLTNRSDSDDLCNEVFYSAYKNFESYDSTKAAYSTWLYVIAGNKLKNYYRDKKNHLSLDDDDEFMVEPSYNPDLDQAIYLEQINRSLLRAIEALPEREAEVVRLKYFSQKSSEEIAAAIGATPGNTRVILTRALNKIAKYFKENNIRWE